jgi:AcrR family transcriptional regulator
MTVAEPSIPSGSALRLVLVAERLFAVRGIEGVSLRQIATEAGSGNNSAVRYHFGSKSGLVSAIFQHRLPQIVSQRRLLIARCDPSDLRSRLEAQILPVLSMSNDPENHYVSFVEQIQRGGHGLPEDLRELPAEGRASNEEFRRDLETILADLPDTVRSFRIDQAQLLSLHAGADRERAVQSGSVTVSFELFANALLDGIAEFLSGPVSKATLRHIDQAGAVAFAGRHML